MTSSSSDENDYGDGERRSTMRSSYSSDGDSEDDYVGAKPSGEQNGGLLYENVDAARYKTFGIDKRHASLVMGGKKGQKIIKPLSNVQNIGSPCRQCGTFSGKDCGCLEGGKCTCCCGENCFGYEGCGQFECGHSVEGVELTSEQQKKDYLDFLCNRTFTTFDATCFRDSCCRVGKNFCCLCGKFDCGCHPISRFCQKYPHVNPGALTQSETTIVNVKETMVEIHNNVCKQIDSKTCLFSWTQLTPVCFVSSDASYRLPECS